MHTNLSARGLKPVCVLAEKRSHGDRLRYMAGCRCDDCRRANTTYERDRQAARKAGDWNGIVPAHKARAHLLALSSQGVGRRAVGDVTDISDTVLSDIRSGRKTQIRARTERKILAVTKDVAANHALTPATGTWELIDRLIGEGYTKGQLAQLLGKDMPALQLNKNQVLVRTAHSVQRLYQKLEAAGFPDSNNSQPVEVLPKNTYRPRPGVLVHRMGDA